MSKYVGSFMFHPVGHGLFYSGTIKNLYTQNQYSFIYDCGGHTKNTVNLAIQNADLPKEIDLLIISHFHADHIKGVLELIKRKITIKTVILPYLDQTSKILYTAALADVKYDLQMSELDELKKFIANPKEFFGDKTEVYFISNDIEDAYSERKNIEENSNQKEEFDFDWKNCKPDKKNKVPCNANYGSKLWSFNFFMPKKNPNFSNLQKFFKDNKITRKNAINNWDIIKKEMKKLGLNNNVSNLICAHGPTENVFVEKICHNKFIPCKHCWGYECCRHYHYHHMHEINIGFQFLTGDAEINDQKAFFNRYQDYLEKSILFQVPHHGSVTNWKDWFSEYQPFCNLWPVTHNASHKYGNGIFPSATFSYIAPYSVTDIETTKLGIQIHFFSKI